MEFIHEYNRQYRPRFNRTFFNRKDEDLIEAIKNVIYSCERNTTFTIKVIDFRVIDNYDDINHILWEYEESIINKNKDPQKNSSNSKSKSGKKKINQFAFINLKDSDLKLIKITYFIQITEKKAGLVNDTLTVYIAIPRIIDGIYFRLNGNMYSAIYQIVDASTYNNSAAKNAKKQSVTFKSIFMASRMYRYYNKLTDINGYNIPVTYFVLNVFTKSVLAMKYLLAQYGFYKTMIFLRLQDIFVVKDLRGIDNKINYIFPVKNLYIVVPKMEFENIQICQSFIYTLYILINKSTRYEYGDIFGQRMYVESLGNEFTAKDDTIFFDKGLNILSSLEFIYDRITMEDLHLTMNDKSDIFRVLRWLMYEFNSLRQKDNLDISTKKVRYAEYLASYYATKLAFGIYRISDRGTGADLNTMRKALQIPPMFLINKITKCDLVNYKNCVNDLDSLIALKYTYKGISGIGEKSNAISNQYRAVHPSHLGRVDIDSSSNSDPGVSGTICPLASLYDGHFTEYMEPSTWEDRVRVVMDQYRAMRSRQSMYRLIGDVSGKQQTEEEIIQYECAEAARDLLQVGMNLMQQGQIEEESIGIGSCLPFYFQEGVTKDGS